MPKLVPGLICLFCFGAEQTATPPVLDRAAFISMLGFEVTPSTNTNVPGGWGGHPSTTISLDSEVVRSGKTSVRMQRNASSEGAFTYLGRIHPVKFTGNVVEIRGYLRTEEVKGFAGLWLRLDGDRSQILLDNMENRHLNGTTGWIAYSIKLPFHPETKRIAYGVLLAGTGSAWADDLEVLVDGKLIADLPQ
jgi:hypothetical protein